MLFSMVVGASGTYVFLELTGKDEVVQEETEQQSNSDQDLVSANLNKVLKAYELITSSYVEKVAGKDLVEGAIEGMLSTLDDPYSTYMDENMAKQFSDILDSTFEGIGAEVGMKDGKIVIVSPFKNSPAEKAGLRANDQILEVDGASVEGLDLYEATLKIRGKKGTMVTLKIARQGLSEPITVDVKRDQIPKISVNGKLKKQNGKEIGYLQITSFSEDTANEFAEQLKELEDKGMDGLIIDVRGNPGGLLPSVEEILKQLISKEKPYYQIEKRDGTKVRYFSGLEKEKEYPVAVLIDKDSASASEILAAALSEAEGYKLIGEKTFGKGTVQQAVPMGDGTNIKLTLFKWLTPDGNWVHKKGIQPDIEVTQPEIFQTHPLQIKKALVKDMNNEQVKNAQQMLNGLGFAPGREDGYFSGGTEAAVKAFQNEKGLEATGIIDQKTASALESAVLQETKKEKNDLQLQTALRYIAK
jgi:carboxyl-terminal processing protease